ncbi:parasitic phase-specific protein psp-1 [Colletotrichum truncatum]|uniref:Parasitic phase-specific protein psp-1 n=1 Tax=Colletotrichum truncatum TaxID=5467 RepID=A0ACC3Z0S8_COLTU|nr:parasitic phase-specific protein psp-1 [Colletotrichum truncatum]KAF6800624.1 parasitic phase-specific protein psp-1 [Colletotrichum truncatum]
MSLLDDPAASLFENPAASLFDSGAYDLSFYNQIYLMMQYCLNNPKNPHCEFIPSYYMYKIDLVPNAIFAGIFGASFIAFAATYAFTRRGHGFNIAMMLGVTCEILGYAGRLMSWNNPWRKAPFLMQICCLTIGPTFFAAAIYFCLCRVVKVFGASNSRIAPEWYTRIFIPCDLISLILQAAGGTVASVANHNGESTDKGDKVMIAGLCFQVFTLLIFMIVAGDFAISTWRRSRAVRNNDNNSNNQAIQEVLDRDAAIFGHLCSSWRFRFFLGALTLSTVCIFWRCVFRIAELSRGWTGPLMERQDLFVGFEGVMIIIAVVGLNFFHPGFCSKELFGGRNTDKNAPFFEGQSTHELVATKVVSGC